MKCFDLIYGEQGDRTDPFAHYTVHSNMIVLNLQLNQVECYSLLVQWRLQGSIVEHSARGRCVVPASAKPIQSIAIGFHSSSDRSLVSTCWCSFHQQVR